MNGIDERLIKLLGQLLNDDEIQRNVAANGIYRHLKQNDIHPSELTILIGDFNSTWRETLKRTQRLDRENSYLRRHLPPALLRRLSLAGEIEYRWPELYMLAQSRFIATPGQKLEKNWRKRLAEIGNVSMQTVQQWEEGIATVPDHVFEKLRAMPDLGVVKPRATTKKKPRSESGGYQWPEALLRRIVTMFLNGASRKAMLEVANAEVGEGVITDGMITSRIDHSPPPDFIKAEVKMGEPLDWPELWLIGATLYRGTKDGKRQRGWRTKALTELGISTSQMPGYDLNQGTTAEKIEALRNKYVEHNLALSQDKVKPFADSTAREPILEMMLRAGSAGVARKEVEHEIGPKFLRRMSELQKSLDIFDTGLIRENQTVYCHRQFSADHPKAWATAMDRYGNMKDDLEKITLSLEMSSENAMDDGFSNASLVSASYQE